MTDWKKLRELAEAQYKYSVVGAERLALAAGVLSLLDEIDGLLTAARSCPACGFEYAHKGQSFEENRRLREQLAAANAEIERLRAEVVKLGTAVPQEAIDAINMGAVSEALTLREQLAAANAEIERLQNRLTTGVIASSPTFGKLREQLAAMTAERDVLAAAVKHGAALYREMTKARDEACDIADHAHFALATSEEEYEELNRHLERLRKVGQ